MREKFIDSASTLITIVMVGCAVWLGISRRLPASFEAFLWPPAPIVAAQSPNNVDDHEPARILSLADVDFSRSSRTLLVVVRSDCRFCTASRPFYAELLKRESATTASVRVFLVGPPGDEGFGTYMTDLRFPSDRRIQVPGSSLGVTGTPTLLLVDRNGRLEDTWIGRLADDEEEQVLEVVFRTAGS